MVINEIDIVFPIRIDGNPGYQAFKLRPLGKNAIFIGICCFVLFESFLSAAAFLANPNKISPPDVVICYDLMS